MMSPHGSIVASFENVESFFAVHTPPDHLIRSFASIMNGPKVLFITFPQDRTYGEIACVAHKFKWQVPVWGNQDWRFRFQNPCYLKRAQQLKPKLYDGSVIGKSNAIVIHDLEETLKLTEESRSKMIQKQNEPIKSKKKVELSAEQAFWSRYSVQPEEPNLSVSTAMVEVPKELLKVSMVNSSLKKLKFHLASFDMVVKERTTATAIAEGTWGFEHTKACFRDDIIPFVKALKELFNSFDQFLIDELTEVQSVFNQMEKAVK
nr:hypothetical protein [Tanacetum cinerariifolium]